ncbi:MAG: F0F1 ATP synthase subunit epsilon [Phycisphaerales bacterium]|jgi:F-type H+-transporting ATPase subunit epsilon
MADTEKTFECQLIGPAGKLLDCRTTSVVFPAHDGQVGVLVDHMPMLSQLGLGVMRVAQSPERGHEGGEPQAEAKFLIDGGFALVAENSVTVIAYNALALKDVTVEAVRSLMDNVNKNLASPGLSPAQQTHENARMRALQNIAESLKS